MTRKFSLKKAFLILSLTTMLSYLLPSRANNTILYNQIGYAKNQLKPIKGKYFKRLNYLIPYLDFTAKKVDINPEHLRMIIWLESEGNPNARNFEEAYYEKHIKGKKLSPLFTEIYNTLKKKGYKSDFSQFKKELATAHGLGQILLKIAYEGGFRETPESLYNKKLNLKIAARIIKEDYQCTRGNPYLISAMYNTGRIDGTPAKGRVQRLEEYLKIVE